MVELVRHIVVNLVDNPDKVDVRQEGDRIKVSVEQSDIGKIIGRRGNIAQSIKTIVRSVSVRNNQKVTVEILDEQQ